MSINKYLDNVILCKGQEKPVILNQGDSLKLVKKNVAIVHIRAFKR